MSKLHNPRIVKIFFSSPFGGMEEEREELTRRYFPSIQHLCNSYGLQFVAVDMRWGITSESSDKAQVINICLHEIDRSDMFVGFFGQRYGWHGSDDAGLQKNFDNALPNYPWLDNVRDKSVTELEFLHGFLNNPGVIPATLYFRDKSYDDMMCEEGKNKGDKKQVSKYSAESEHSTQLMNDLKHRVLQHKEQSLGVYMDYKTPAEAAKIMYDTIMSYLKDTLLVNYSTQQLSIRAELKLQHDAFLASRDDIYIGGEMYLQQLNDELSSENNRHILLTGEAGCGKSALLCNWINTLKQQHHDNYVVIYHFIGFAEGSTDVTRMLMRMVEECMYVVSKFIDGEPTEMTWDNLPDDEDEMTRYVMNTLISSLEKLITYGKTPILVFDGIEKLLKVSNIKKVLFWLPTNLPSSCFTVVSTKLSDIINIDELKTRNYTTIHIETLGEENKRDLCVKVLKKSGKELSTEQLDCIVSASMTRNPLFLRVTLSELVSFGYFRLLDKKISSLISSESIEALFRQVLLRLEEDYNVTDYNGNLVEQVMCCLSLSSQGLSEVEIKEIFTLPDHVWSPLYFAIENLTINQSGRIQFGFNELNEAVEQKYMQDHDKRNYYINILVQYYEASLKKLDETCHLTASSFTLLQPAYELPNLYLKLENTRKLAACLSNFFVFTYLYKHSLYQLVILWHHTSLPGSQIRDLLLSSFDKRLTEIYLDMERNDTLQTEPPPGYKLLIYLEDVIDYLKTSGYREESIQVIQRAINITEDAMTNNCVCDKKECNESLYLYKYKLACIYTESYHTARQGIHLHEEIIQYYKGKIETEGSSQHYLVGLANSYHGIGVAFLTLKDFEKAEETIQKSIKYIEEADGKDRLNKLAVSWNMLGLCLLFLNQLEEALKYFNLTLEAYEKIYLEEDPPVIGETLTNKGLCLRKLGLYDECEQTYKRAIEVKIKAVGKEHSIVALSYTNLCSLELYRNNFQAALQYCMEAKEIFETIEQTWNNPDYIAVIENMMINYLNMEKYEDADKYCLTILEWRQKDKSMDRCVSTIYLDMARYYLRESQYKNAYTVTYALVDSVHAEKDGCIAYILLDFACCKLPIEYSKELPKKFTIQHMVERYPDNPNLIKQLIIGHYVPNNDLDGISRIIEIHSAYNDMGDGMYNLISEHWCSFDNGEINLSCQHRVLQDGLNKYPDSIELNLSIAKYYRRVDDPVNALIHAQKVIEDQRDNPVLILFVIETAVLARDVEFATKWCTFVEQNFTDENVINRVTALKEVMKNAGENG